jgi:exodeoxyribonuclease VII large subunit
MLNIIGRRFPGLAILIHPVQVQGEGAAAEIAAALDAMGKRRDLDVLIVGRGGGSLEDLWAFNEEPVARAIFASGIPVISAVGHETDYTIADFTADLRAPTPSAAAEMVVESEAHLRERIGSLESRLVLSFRQELDHLAQTVRNAVRFLGDPRRKMQQYVQRVDELAGRLGKGLRHHVRRDRERLGALTGALDHLNPLSILARGYSITRRLPDGAIVKDAAELNPGDLLQTRLHAGAVLSRVQKPE